MEKPLCSQLSKELKYRVDRSDSFICIIIQNIIEYPFIIWSLYQPTLDVMVTDASDTIVRMNAIQLSRD